jgi:hypothetical protein
MPRTEICDQAYTRSMIPVASRRRYLVVRRQDAWFIMFNGEEFGPYQSEREAQLFAIDAAHELAEYGQATEVMMADEAGGIVPLWVHGEDAFPPRG